MSSQGEANGEGSPPPPPPLLLPHPSLLFAFYQLWQWASRQTKTLAPFQEQQKVWERGAPRSTLGCRRALARAMRGERAGGGRGLFPGGVAKEGWQGGHVRGARERGGSGEAKPEQNQGLAGGVNVRRRKGSAGWRGHERNDPCCLCGVRRLGASRGCHPLTCCVPAGHPHRLLLSLQAHPRGCWGAPEKPTWLSGGA